MKKKKVIVQKDIRNTNLNTQGDEIMENQNTETQQETTTTEDNVQLSEENNVVTEEQPTTTSETTEQKEEEVVDTSAQQEPTQESAPVDTSAVDNKTVDTNVISQAPEVINTKDENLTDFEKFERKILNEGGEFEKSLVLGLQEYLEFMKPKKPVSPDEGLKKQRELLQHIKGTLRIQDNKDFKKCWKLLIKYFAEHTQYGKALHETYINRFTEHWSTGPDQLNAFRDLTHLLKETAQKGISNVQKTVSLDAVVKSGYFTEEERNKLIDFYNN